MSRKNRQKGSAMLELAISVTLLVLLLAGVIEFGRAFYTATEISNAARAGVQYAAINSNNASDYTGMQQAALNDAVNVSGVSAAASQFCECPNGTAANCGTATCSLLRKYVKVVTSVQYRPMADYPGIPNPMTITSQATMRVQ